MDESILHKIQALLNKTENQGASPAEAAAAAAKAQDLLQKYNLDLSEVLNFTPEQSESQKIDAARIDFYQEWKSQLLGVLARTNFCRVIVTRRKNYAQVVGRRTNIEVVVYLYNSVRQQLEAMNIRDWDGYGSRRNFNKAWFLGAINTIYDRLQTQQRKFEATSKGSALVVANKALVSQWIQENIGDVRPGRTKHYRTDQDAYALGVQAGRQATLNQALGGVNSPRQIEA